MPRHGVTVGKSRWRNCAGSRTGRPGAHHRPDAFAAESAAPRARRPWHAHCLRCKSRVPWSSGTVQPKDAAMPTNVLDVEPVLPAPRPDRDAVQAHQCRPDEPGRRGAGRNARHRREHLPGMPRQRTASAAPRARPAVAAAHRRRHRGSVSMARPTPGSDAVQRPDRAAARRDDRRDVSRERCAAAVRPGRERRRAPAPSAPPRDPAEQVARGSPPTHAATGRDPRVRRAAGDVSGQRPGLRARCASTARVSACTSPCPKATWRSTRDRSTG